MGVHFGVIAGLNMSLLKNILTLDTSKYFQNYFKQGGGNHLPY